MGIELGKTGIPVSMALIILGALLALVSMFMGHVTHELLSQTNSGTGWDLITHSGEVFDDPADTLSFLRWFPLLTVLFLVIAAVMAILPKFVDLPLSKNVLGIIVLALVIVSVILALVFVLQGATSALYTGMAKDLFDGLVKAGLKVSLGIGAYLALISAIISAVGAGIALKENL